MVDSTYLQQRTCGTLVRLLLPLSKVSPLGPAVATLGALRYN